MTERPHLGRALVLAIGARLLGLRFRWHYRQHQRHARVQVQF